jgi:hypothetical protein
MSNNTDIIMPGTGTPDGEPPRPRYYKKRYVIPLGIVGGIVTPMPCRTARSVLRML